MVDLQHAFVHNVRTKLMSMVGIAKYSLQVIDMLCIALYQLIAGSSFFARSTESILQSYKPGMNGCPHYHLHSPDMLAVMSSVRIYPHAES